MRINNPFVITPNSVFTAALQPGSVTQSKIADAATVYGGVRIFTTTGSFTPTHTKEYLIILVGGGGGGCSGAGYTTAAATNYVGGKGGAAGETKIITATLTAGSPYMVGVGLGGAGGIADPSGGANVVGNVGGLSGILTIGTAAGGLSKNTSYITATPDQNNAAGQAGTGLNSGGATDVYNLQTPEYSGANAVGFGGGGSGGSSQWRTIDATIGGNGGNGADGLVVIVW